MRGSQASHENPTWIRKALGDIWEHQLTAVLRDINCHNRRADTADSPRNSGNEEGPASQRTVGLQLQPTRSSSPMVAEHPEARIVEH